MDTIQEIDMSAFPNLHAWVHSGKCGEENPEWFGWLTFLTGIERVVKMIPATMAMHEDNISAGFSARSTFMFVFCQELKKANVNFAHESRKLRMLLAPEKRGDFAKMVSEVISAITSTIQLVEKEIPSCSL